MPKFKYKQLFDDVTNTFKFGDTYKGKAEEIGITYHDFVKMRDDKPVSIEVVIALTDYMILHYTEDIDNIGDAFLKYIEQ